MTQHEGTTPAGASDLAATPAADTAPSSATAGAAAGATDPHSGEEVTVDEVRASLRRVKDPELNLNIVDLGLIYEIAVEGAAVTVDMSLTSPGCPSGPEIMRNAEDAVKAVPGVGEATINLVWSPIWTPERIEPRVRSYLGF
jgi:metal-sulfur cluster biosynthetic enzyme